MPVRSRLRHVAVLPILLGTLTAALFTFAQPAEAMTRSQRVGVALDIVRNQKGDPYRYGAAGPNAFDCSGLTYYSFRRAGFVNIPRTHDSKRPSRITSSAAQCAGATSSSSPAAAASTTWVSSPVGPTAAATSSTPHVREHRSSGTPSGRALGSPALCAETKPPNRLSLGLPWCGFPAKAARG